MKLFSFVLTLLFACSAWAQEAVDPVPSAPPSAAEEPLVSPETPPAAAEQPSPALLHPSIESLVNALCEKSVSCNEGYAFEQCRQFFLNPLRAPDNQKKMLGYRELFDGCEKALKKASCESVLKEAPKECRFLSEI